MHLLFLSCLKATELIEKKIRFKLNLIEKMQLKAHKMMCNACTNYEKHSVLLEKGISKSYKYEFTEAEINLLKQTINEKLEEFRQ